MVCRLRSRMVTSVLSKLGMSVALGVAVTALAIIADRHDCRAGLGLPIHSCRWPSLHDPVPLDPLGQLRWHPLDGTAYRRLADVRAAEGRSTSAAVLRAVAYRRAPRDPVLAESHMHQALVAGDWRAAAGALDRRLRLDPTASPEVLQAWFELTDAGAPGPASALGALLVADPPWRPWLLPLLESNAATVPVLEAAVDAGAVLTPGELGALLVGLADAGNPAWARLRWRSWLSGEARAVDDGRVFDPSFSGVAAPLPFAWEISDAPGAYAVMEDGLVVHFAGRPADYTGVSQQLALAPGRYSLSTRWSSGLKGAREVAWVLSCDSSGTELARIRLFPPPGPATGTASPFAVPPNCPMQRLQLVAIARNLSMRALEGELRVERIAVEDATSIASDATGGVHGLR